MGPFEIVKGFECELAKRTGAPFVVAVNSCSAALMLAFLWYKKQGGTYVQMPRKTYPSVPMGAYHAGLDISYREGPWEGAYDMPPSNIWDCAKRLTSGMYVKGQVQCVSFHVAKILKMGQGGAILHDDPKANEYYMRMRFDGRTEGVATKDDNYEEPGYHCYLSPDVAARGLWMLSTLPQNVPDQEMHDYPDMSVWTAKWKR